MSKPRFPEEFRIEAIKQVTERGYPLAEVASRPSRNTASPGRAETGNRGTRHPKKCMVCPDSANSFCP